MKKKFLAIFGISLLAVSTLFAVQVRSIDSGVVNVSLKNNKANILNFPFIVSNAQIATSNPNAFKIKAENDSIVVIPTATVPSTRADLIVWSQDGYTYLLKINIKGKSQVWDFTSNRVDAPTNQTIKYESGSIDSDVRNLIKTVMLKNNIPGYKKVKVKRQFETPDLLMQKDYIFNGSRYRVEKWFLKNKTGYPIELDEGNIYTRGILAIAFKPRTIPPHEIGIMYLVIDKASIEKKGFNNG